MIQHKTHSSKGLVLSFAPGHFRQGASFSEPIDIFISIEVIRNTALQNISQPFAL